MPSTLCHDATLAGEVLDQAATGLELLRARAPRVHCLTNLVATSFTANVLLAAGAIPSMTVAPDEIGAFVASAEALLVNLGTFDPERERAALSAIAAARAAGRRFVLDPVFIERSPARADFARHLIGEGPAIIRLNAAELRAFGEMEEASAFACAHGTVIALTGARDLVTDGARSLRIANGHPLMAKVTATGCAAGALAAAFLSVLDDPLAAASAALLVWGVAGEIAGEGARGPGGFVPALIDALHGLDVTTLKERGRVD